MPAKPCPDFTVPFASGTDIKRGFLLEDITQPKMVNDAHVRQHDHAHKSEDKVVSDHDFHRSWSPSLVQSPSWLAGPWTGQWRVPPRFLPELLFRNLPGEMRGHCRPVDPLADDLHVDAFTQLSQGRLKGRERQRVKKFLGANTAGVLVVRQHHVELRVELTCRRSSVRVSHDDSFARRPLRDNRAQV